MDPEQESSEAPHAGSGDAVDDRGVLDLAAWERYLGAFDRHSAHLYRLTLLLYHGDRHIAEDVVHDLFVAAHPPWRDGRIDDLGAYLRRSLATRVVSSGRERTMSDRFARRSHAHDDVGPLLGDHIGAFPTLQSGLDRLPTRQRLAVVLRYYEGLSVSEIAAMLDEPSATVEAQLSGALQVLRNALEATS